MHSVMFIFKRQNHLTLEEFYEHYEHVHGPIARRLKGLIEYRQHPTRKPGVGDGAYMSKEAPYDAASVYTFESPEAAEKAWISDVGKELDIDTYKLMDTKTMISLPIAIREVISHSNKFFL
ncbi:EthD domain-containing protein [Priestia endophytica]|uniref:EthD domain-containing protein n=1 Tax=Priestia endophytica TaxID=135735 RepID=UPI002E1DADF0|nr:EthD domain-containing protein [Priestia endophytica]